MPPDDFARLTFRPVAVNESLDDLFDLDDLAFHETTGPDRRTHLSERMDRHQTLCAYADGQLVGTSLVWPQQLSVPGGQMPCGAVSWVSVAPTHRRRGLLRTMIEGQLTRLLEAGTPLAALWASEATIYGRFGFAVATWCHSYDIRLRDRDSGITDSGPGPSVRLLDPITAGDALSDVYDRAAQQRAGVLSRSRSGWIHGVLANPDDHGNRGQLRVVGAGDPLTGYALYYVGHDGTAPGGAGSVLRVKELVATSSEAARALWRYLLSIDLAGRLKAPLRPTDDPLSAMLQNHRTAERTEQDGLWIRLLDLPRTLQSRQWSAPLDLVLEVEDALVPANAGRWALTGSGGQARCAATDRPADLVLGITQLGAIYLGGGSLVRAVDAGLVHERTPGAAATLDHAARTPRAPWNVAVF